MGPNLHEVLPYAIEQAQKGNRILYVSWSAYEECYVTGEPKPEEGMYIIVTPDGKTELACAVCEQRAFLASL